MVALLVELEVDVVALETLADAKHLADYVGYRLDMVHRLVTHDEVGDLTHRKCGDTVVVVPVNDEDRGVGPEEQQIYESSTIKMQIGDDDIGARLDEETLHLGARGSGENIEIGHGWLGLQRVALGRAIRCKYDGRHNVLLPPRLRRTDSLCNVGAYTSWLDVFARVAVAGIVRRMSQPTPVTIARGDGIGPEIMDAALHVLEAAGAELAPEFIDIGERVYLSGNSAGIGPEAWESIRRTKVLFKSPITTPQGGGYKSLNVTIRKSLGLFANVRPVQAYNPYVETHYPDMDIVIVRENEEDLYAGIEHRQTRDVTQCLKLISRPGSERIVRYAFEYARAYGRSKVTCMIKDNIMKVTDGLFHRVFDEISADYPDIEADQQIIDIGTARVATAPERYDVIVTPNLYGDIISDVVAEISGSVGLAGSANIGVHVSMFEAIHGSAPDIAGQNVANPSGLINAAVQMLVHIGQPAAAAKVSNAWLTTLEDGIHTADVYRPGHSEHLVGTREFAQAIAERIGRTPRRLRAWSLDDSNRTSITVPGYTRPERVKRLVGVDLFLDWVGDPMDAGVIGREVERLTGTSGTPLALKMITNRGVKVYPDGFPETFLTDHWRCRFVAAASLKKGTGDAGQPAYDEVKPEVVIDLMTALMRGGLDVIKSENLYTFDGERGFSLGQGE